MKRTWGCILFLFTIACSEQYTPPEREPAPQENNGSMMPVKNAFVEVSPPLGVLVEGGAPTAMMVTLLQAPTAPVTLTWETSANARGTISPESITITPDGWDKMVRVEVSPDEDDDVAQGSVTWDIRTTVVSDDTRFDSVVLPVFQVETVDNDVAPVLIAATQGSAQTTEAGQAVTLQVSLSRQPTDAVVVPVASSNTEEGVVDVDVLTFTRLDWNIPQVVTVTGVDDMVADGDQTYFVEFDNWNSEDEAFNGTGRTTVMIVNVDGVCGNGVVDGQEPCEPGDRRGCEYGDETCEVCDTTCAYVPSDGTGFCGDGEVQSEGGEQCDAPTKVCAYGQRSCTTCSSSCKNISGELTGFCGDGEVQSSHGEQCEGPTEPCVYGERSCTTCSSSCRQVPGTVTGFCGDGRVQPEEECDGPTEPCPYGEMSCVTCSSSCREIAGQVTGFCGDGQVQAAQEVCEGTTTEVCPLYGTMACGSDCELDTSGCIGAVAVEGRYRRTCMLLDDGEVRCWGDGAASALIDTETDVAAFTVSELEDVYCVTQRSNGYVSCVGLENVSAPPGGARDVVLQAERGSDSHWPDGFQNEYLCDIDSAGEVHCGFVRHKSYQNRPFKATCNFSHSTTWMCNPIRSADNQGFVDLEAGDSMGFLCARKANGETHCWNERGWSSSVKRQTAYKALDLSGWEDVCGVRQTDGGVDCWEARDTTVTHPTSAVGFSDLATWGLQDGCGLNAQGFSCWGSPPTGVPNTMSGSFVELSALYDGLCAIQADGGVQCWGNNSRGVLNIPTTHP